MNDLPILYSFRRCPYAIRSRMAIAVSGVQMQLREVVLKNKPPELLLTSPKGTVPVVRRVDGSVLEQSLDILDWVLSISDPAGWKAYPSDVLAEMAKLIEENDVSFKQHLDQYKYADRYPDESKETYRARCHTYLQKLEDRLSVQPHLFSERVSYADVAIFPFVRQFSKVDEQWFAQAPYPALRNWLGRFATGDLFISVMKKYKPWRQGNPSMLFPGI